MYGRRCADGVQAGVQETKNQHAADDADRRALAAAQRHAADNRRRNRRNQSIGERHTGRGREAVAQQRAAERGEHSRTGKYAQDDGGGANAGHHGGAPIASGRVNVAPDPRAGHDEGGNQKRRECDDAAQRQHAEKRMIDGQRHIHAWIADRNVAGDDISQSAEGQQTAERHADRSEPQSRHDGALKQPPHETEQNGQSHPDDGMLATGHDRDTSGEADHAADRQVDLAQNHRQPKAERDRSDGGELLQHAEGRRGGEKGAATVIKKPQHHADGDEQHIGTDGAVGEQRAHLHFSSNPQASAA